MNKPAQNEAPLKEPPDARGIVQGVRAVSASEFRAVPATPLRVITAPHWLLEMLTAGDLEVNPERSGWRRRTPGTGMLYAPGTRYQERRVETGRRRGYASLFVFFAADQRDAGRLLPTPGRFAWIEDADRLIERLLSDVVAGLDAGLAAAMSATGSLYQMLGLLLAADRRGDSLVVGPRGAAISDRVASLHRYMREHLADPIRLRDLADCVGLSESALSHAYRRTTGRTPMAALRGFRVEAAKLHLLRGSLNLQRIADLTGFADAFHLSRTFKKLTGQSPRQFRG